MRKRELKWLYSVLLFSLLLCTSWLFMTNAGNSKIQAEEATNTSEPEVEQSTSGSKEFS
ncbi:hypothetical protein GQR36_13210 [Enterococcus termitis]